MKLLLKCIAGLFLCTSLVAVAAPTDYKEGLYYHALKPNVATSNTDSKIEVIEVFFYACPHCNVLEPKVTKWLEDKKDRISFKRMPAIIGPSWIEQAKAYYTAERLGILDRLHPLLFKAIHEKGEQYYNSYAVKKFFLENGVTEQDFIRVYNSAEVSEDLNQARIMTVKYNLRGVPAMIINGKYKTAQYFTGTQETMLDVVDFLVKKERLNK